jgi:hypothetical protein
VEVSGSDSNDLGVSLTWKQRTYDADTDSYVYVATTNVLTYTAVNRLQDSVGDGIPDWWRVRYFGGTGTTTNSSSCAVCDPDQDGASNAAEFAASTDPTNVVSALRLLPPVMSATELLLTWDAVPGKRYVLQSATKLTADWVDVPGTTTNAVGTSIRLRLPVPTDSPGFYRIKLIAP